MMSEQDVVNAKAEAFKDYAKQLFDDAVAAVQNDTLQPQEPVKFQIPDGAEVEKMPDGSFKWTVRADSKIDEFVRAELTRLGVADDTK